MQVKNLQQKRVLRAALLVLLLGAVGMTKGYAYDFSAVCSTGQTLYYSIIDTTNCYVCVVNPGSSNSFPWDPWNGFIKPSGDLDIPENVAYNGAIYCITRIGEYAFYHCGLTSVTIPNSVTSIVEQAFYGCSGLTTAHWNAVNVTSYPSNTNYHPFKNCSNLTTVVFGDQVQTIPAYAFYGCSGLTDLTIGNSVTSIGSYAFYSCSGLTDLTIGNSVTSIGSYAFYSCSGLTGSLTIPNSVTSIGSSAFGGCSGLTTAHWNAVNVSGYPSSSAFGNCSNLTTVVFGDQVQTIPANAFYNCSSLAGILTIGNSVTSIGDYAFRGCSGLTDLTIGNSVTSIGSYAFYSCSGLTDLTIPNSVTSIGSSAFYNCSGLTDLTIGNSVTSIGDYAFYGCSGLTTVHWNAVNVTSYPTSTSNHPFKNCTSLTTVVFGDQVQTIPAHAFENCSGLTALTIGNSVTSIGDYAFRGCSGLTDLTIGNSVTSIGDDAFRGCSGLTDLTIGNSVTSIGSYAFYGCSGLTTAHWNAVNVSGYPSSSAFGNCSNLTTVVFGDQVQTIPAYAFSGCSGLTDLTIGNSVTSIGDYAFRGCSGLTDLTIGNSVTSIGYSAFSGCSGLTDLTIGNSVTSIGDYAFRGCSGLTDLTIGNSVTSIYSYAFYGCSGLTTVNWNAVNVTSYPSDTYYHPFKNCSNLTTVVFGDQVQTIPAYAFSGCSGLTDLTIGNSVTSIGDYAFRGCSGLTDLTIGNSVTSIGYSAFSGCSGLTDLTIGNSVTSIGDYAFRGCSGLTDLTIGNSVTSIGDDAFSGCSGLTDLTIGNSVTSIGSYAFSGCSGLTTAHWNAVNVSSYPSSSAFGNCSNLTTVVFGDQVQTIPAHAFENCSGLTDLTIGNSVTSIGSYAFYSCSGLTDLTIGNSVTSIGSYAFYSCSGLTDLTIGNSVTSIGSSAFYNCSGLTGSLTIPNSVTSIGNSAFYNCSGLEAVYYTGDIAQWCNIQFVSSSSNPLCYAHNFYIDDVLVTDLVIPESVTEIKNFAFYNCSGLTGTLAIPNSVTSIGNSAFAGCWALTGTLNIGNSVATMGTYAFSNCTGINAIRLQCPAPPTISANSFYNIDKSIPVFVACGTQEAYMAADYWSEFTAINESPYDLIITQNDPYGGEVSVIQYADCEDNHCAILAINNIGYNFVGWFVNDYFSTDSPYCDFSLIDNVTFEARFERKPDHFITIVTSTSNTWSNPDTWDTGEVPSATSTVGIYKDIIVDVDAEVEQIGIYNGKSITILPEITFTVIDELESNSTSSIIIEDGGQLYHSNDEAMATVKKSIEPYTTDADGWNLISYPLTGNGTVASIGNMLNNEYDLYAYDEPTQYWINQKEESNGFTALEAGQGYLYANKGTGMGLAAGSKIGEGTSTIGYTPFYTYYEYSIAENLFLASELEAAGLPTTALGGLCWYATNQTGYLQSNISIWMANVNDEALMNTSHNVSEMTLVYTGDMTPVVGWNAFVFNENNFTWDGSSNVLVCVQRNNGTYNSTVYWQAHNPGFAATSYKYNYSSAYDMTSGTYSMNVSSTLRPNTIFQTSEQVGEYEYYEPITMSFAGEMENGAAMVTVPLNYTETAGNLKGFNLVGNPYVHNVTSYASTNVAEGCFRLNETRDNLIVSEVSETQPLHPAEGFFVKATAEEASITFNPQRGATMAKTGSIRVEVSKDNRIVDRLLVKDAEGQPLEKFSLNEKRTKVFAVQGQKDLAIVPCEGNEQPFSFKAAKDGQYTINVDADGMEFTYLHLIDNLTGNDVNLLVEPSYSFDAKTTDYASRFKLVFATGSSVDSESDTFAFLNSSGNLTIYGVDDEVTLQVVDVLGHVLSTERFSGSYEKKLNVAPGVYMLRIINGDEVKVQKIIIKN